MPSSGYGIENIIKADNADEHNKMTRYINECVAIAQKHGLFIEWLESFVAAWNKTKDPYIAARAGLDEWDM